MLRAAGSSSKWALLCLWPALFATACTSSENQLFTPFVMVTPAAGTGGSSGSGSGGSSGTFVLPSDEDAGTVKLNDGLDPDASFTWTVTLPGKGTCDPGHYTGSFECDFQGQGGLGKATGTIEVTLGGSSEKNGLSITDGRISGYGDPGSWGFSALLGGQLDCTNASLAATTKGSTTPPAGLPAWGIRQVDGTLAGKFDAKALTVKGTLTLHTDTSAECMGTWSVRAL